VFVSVGGNDSPAPGRAHGQSYFITRSTTFTAVRSSVTISQPLVTLTKRAHRSRPPRLLQEEHGCLERGACSLAHSLTLPCVSCFSSFPLVGQRALLDRARMDPLKGSLPHSAVVRFQRNRLAWLHRRRGLASTAYGMRAHGAASAAGFEALRD